MRLEVACENRPGVARQILDVLSAAKINVLSGEFASERYIYLHTPDMSFNQLQSVLPQIRAIDGVDDAHPIPLMPSEKRQVEQQTLLDSLTDSVLSVDLEGRVLAGNQAAAELLQIDRAELPGYSLERVIDNLSLVELIHQTDGLASEVVIQLSGRAFQARMTPIRVPVRSLGYSLTGAVLALKRPGPVSTEGLQAVASFDQLFHPPGQMPSWLRRARRFARLDQSLLIEGETGSGKTLLAQACHRASRVADGPLVVLDCSSMSDQQLEAELFGVLLSDLEVERPGLLEQAAGGTLLLEQVAEMSALLQQRLLRFIETGRFHRRGGHRELMVEVRVIATSQQNLLSLCGQGVFRFDLYYRLSELVLNIPPLRQQRQEIAALAEHLLQQLASQNQLQPATLAVETVQQLQRYSWPGNVRELQSQLLAALVGLDRGGVLLPQHLRLPSQSLVLDSDFIDCDGSLDQAARRFEARLLAQLYPDYPSSRLLGKRLGLSHTAVAKKLRAYGIGKARGSASP
ncbi:MAG: sigma 54-interacting transcriptional regulator [Halopseudomonas sp.]